MHPKLAAAARGKRLQTVKTAYDEVPYENRPFPQALPRVHATVAALHGLTPPDPRTARVLELGCGAGAHLAGVAAADPGVRAVGVDLAATAIEVARATAAAAGLENVRFDVADVLELTDGQLGEFDYVIAHGLYAWVPEPVREAALAACRAHLAPEGIADVSYNAYPGGHMRRMLREMAEWHARGVTEPPARAQRARELFALLDALGKSDGPSFYGGSLADDVEGLAKDTDASLVHDLLSPDYGPVWFRDFASAAGRHGLAYVGDAIPDGSREPTWSDSVSAFVAEGAGQDRVAYEQYFDLLVLRHFRHSLLCRDTSAPVAGVDRSAVQRLLVAANDVPAALPEPLRPGLAGVNPMRPLPFEELRERLGAPADALVELLVQAFNTGAVAFHAVPPPSAPAPGIRPRASALARGQARPGATVTTLLNGVVRVTDEPTAALLRLVDGTRDRAAILDAFPGPLDLPSLDTALATFADLGLLHE